MFLGSKKNEKYDWGRVDCGIQDCFYPSGIKKQIYMQARPSCKGE